MSGILDYLESGWPSILGMNSGQSTPTLPPPQAPAGGGFSPSGGVDGGSLGADWTSMPNAAGNPGGGPDPYTSVPIPPSAYAAAGVAPNGGGAIAPAQAAPAPAPGGPPPMPVPNGAAAIPYQNITGQTPAPPPTPQGPLNIVPPNGMSPGNPMSLAPPNPGGAGAGPPGNNLAQILGAIQQRQPNPIGAGMAALGKGLSTVSGNTGAGAFARGMGGALTGGSQYNQQQQTQLFNQSSTAFRDMLAAKNQDDTEGYRRAQGAYLTARAQAIQVGGGTGSNAWQSSPYGKTIQVENEAQKYEKGQQIILQKQWALNGASPDQQQTDLDGLTTKVDSYRQRLYKSAGIDPSDGQKMLTYGTSKDTPFQTKGMTLDQFNAQVPMGAWYTDQNGDKRQRTVAPAQGGAAQPSAPQSNGQQMQDYYDTSMAMQPSQ